METVGPSGRRDLDLDVSLLSGFEFRCRPDCGLCCFASPRLDSGDEQRLRQALPMAPVVVRAGERCIPSRPDGGACRLLTSLRCSAHAARPAPCREFPVLVHIGSRLQATLVLSCPGLSLEPLRSFAPGGPVRPWAGLETELRSVRDRLTPATERLRLEAIRRRRRVLRQLTAQGRWADEEEVRRALGARSLVPTPDEFFPDDLPDAESGLESLPAFFDARPGPVALAQTLDAWEALELDPEGGARSVGRAVPPDRAPQLDEEATEFLNGYLRYWLARDGFLAAVHQDMLSVSGGTVVEAALEELHAIGSDVLARAAVRAQLRGEGGVRLRRADVERGIRATDQDWLDRPTWGGRL